MKFFQVFYTANPRESQKNPRSIPDFLSNFIFGAVFAAACAEEKTDELVLEPVHP